MNPFDDEQNFYNSIISATDKICLSGATLRTRVFKCWCFSIDKTYFFYFCFTLNLPM